MKKTKRRVLVSVSILSTLLVSACSLIALNETNNRQALDSGELVVSPIEGIKILSAQSSEDGKTITVTYNVTPSNITSVNFNTKLEWQSSEKDTYESTTWHQDKDPYNYISFSINQSAKEIAFTCSQAFGREIVFTLQSPNNENIKASMTINYKRRAIKDPTVNFSSTTFKDGESITITKVLPEYSIGSIGDRVTDTFKTTPYYLESGTYTYNSLFKGINKTGLYSNQWIYNNKTYTDSDSVLADMKANVEEYFLSFLTFGEHEKFSKETLAKILTYKYAAYSMGSSIGYNQDESNYTYFLERYNLNYSNNAQFVILIESSGESYNYKETTKFSLSVDETFLTDLGINDTTITF